MFSNCIHKLSPCHPNVLSVVGQFVLKTMPSQFIQALCCDLCNYWTHRTCCSGKCIIFQLGMKE